MPTFDPTITLGNIFTVVAFLFASLLAWRDLNWRVRNIENWKEEHLHTAEEALRNIGMLRDSVVKLTAIADGNEHRLRLLEEFRMQQRRTQ